MKSGIIMIVFFFLQNFIEKVLNERYILENNDIMYLLLKKYLSFFPLNDNIFIMSDMVM